MRKTFKVVMLPTKWNSILLDNRTIKLEFYNGDYQGESSVKEPQHLYIVSNNKIMEGDWCIQFNDIGTEPKELFQRRGLIPAPECFVRKVEASTQRLNVGADNVYPTISESFINAYIKAHNEGKPITEVDLEIEYNKYSDLHGVKYEIKTRPDNTIIIYQSKMYSKEEVIQSLNGLLNDVLCKPATSNNHVRLKKYPNSNYVADFINEWSEENL